MEYCKLVKQRLNHLFHDSKEVLKQLSQDLLKYEKEIKLQGRDRKLEISLENVSYEMTEILIADSRNSDLMA